MRRKMVRAACLIGTVVAALAVRASADEALDKLISSGKYKEAVEYADNNLPTSSRTSEVWVKVGKANEKLGLTEKALACYLVSWRMNPQDYESLLGAAKIYNKLGQSENAMSMAKKALDVNFTGEASWEYARACIALDRPAEAKKALEKVIETDPSNIVANRELGNIYFDDKQYDKAIPLLKKAYGARKDSETALSIGLSYKNMGVWDSALVYIEDAITRGLKKPQITLDLARIYFGQKNYDAAARTFDKAIKDAKFEAKDYYMRAVAEEQTGDKSGAMQAYRQAVKAFGSSKQKEAILARLEVGKDLLEAKNYSVALKHFEFINEADKGGKIVPNVYFLLADTYQGLKNTSKAIASLEKAIGKDNKNYEAYARLAELYEKAGMSAKAEQTYETMKEMSPNDPKVYLVLGDFKLSANEYTEALQLYQKADELKSTAQSLRGIAKAAIELKQYNRAREAAKKAVQKDGSLVDCRKILVQIYMRAKEYGDAKEHLEYLVGVEKYNKNYWLQLAECYEGLGQKDKLAKADERLIQIDKKNVKSRVRLADYLLEKGKLEEAYQHYKQVALLEPKNVDAHKQLYELATKLDRKTEAVSYLKKYLALRPKDAEAQRDLGDLLYEKKQFDGALEAYRMVIKLDPSMRGFYKRYADIVIKKGLQSEVIKALSTLIASGDADLSAYTTLGMIYQQQKSYQKALDVYQKALVLDPQNANVLSAYASCQAATGDIKGAIITYEQAVMMDPKAVDELKDLADLYSKQKRTEQAMETYMKYLDKKPSDQEVARKVGRYAYDKKMYEKAYKYLNMVKGSEADDFYHLVMLAESAYYTKKYQKVPPVLEGLRKRNPKLSTLKDILLMLARSYEKLGKNLDAARTYATYEGIRGVSDTDAAYKSAALQEKANPGKAQEIYETNVRKFPRDYRNYLKLGLIYADKKETLPKSVEMLRKASSLADTIPSVWLELATVYGKLGKENEELNAYKRYAKHDPQNLQANKRIGTILLKKGKTTEGMVYLETANAVSPNDPELMLALAKGYVKTNRKREAIELLKKVKATRKQDPEVRLQLFELYRDLDMLREAEEEIKQLIALKRDNRYLLAHAKLLKAQGKEKNAADVLENILATNPESLEALMLKGKILRQQKKYEQAIEVYKEAAYVDPNNAEAIFERAETYMQMAKPQWAETFYKRVLRANSKYALAELGLAKVAKLRKNESLYKKHVARAKSLDPANPEILAEYKKAHR